MKEGALSKFCKTCKLRKLCDEEPPHSYDNPIYHDCIHKKDIVADLFGL